MMHASPRHAKSAVKKMRKIHVPNLSQFSNKNFPIEDCVQSYLILFLQDHAMAMNSYGVTNQIKPVCENFCVVLFTSCDRTKRRLNCFANYFLVQYV